MIIAKSEYRCANCSTVVYRGLPACPECRTEIPAGERR